ncbi:MAG: hypothetical protein HWQ41_15200 [Nostoc sp. NOS(2021)]|uniref:hypothetical protein n=1 Tax=Nostoc sp. NOS(2021) TaxID=2815407 RepID=UPI0025FFB668|nr:hypothetical protein [Nostoc sp. NOS(2021)]MBN3896554.1 hypothetical protein [Nostoc sp. NOS(2021)]
MYSGYGSRTQRGLVLALFLPEEKASNKFNMYLVAITRTSTLHGVSSSEVQVPSSKHGVSCSEVQVPSSKHGVSCSEVEVPSSKHGVSCSEVEVPSSKHKVSCSEVEAELFHSHLDRLRMNSESNSESCLKTTEKLRKDILCFLAPPVAIACQGIQFG